MLIEFVVSLGWPHINNIQIIIVLLFLFKGDSILIIKIEYRLS